MREHDLRRWPEKVDAFENAVTDLRMLAHLGPFRVRQRPRLEQDAVGHADLADVVQQRATPDVLERFLGDAHLPPDGERVADDALRVIARLVLAGVERVHQRRQRAPVCLRNSLQRRLQLGGPLAHAAREALVVPRARVGEPAAAPGALDGAHQLGHPWRLEQVVGGAAPEAVDRALGVAVAGEHHHRRVRMPLQHLIEQPQPVVCGHLHVAEDEGQVVAAQHLQRGFGAVRLADDVTLLAKHGGEHFAHGAVVVDDQHGRRLLRLLDGRQLGRGIDRVVAGFSHAAFAAWTAQSCQVK